MYLLYGPICTNNQGFVRQVLKFNVLLAFDHFYGVDYRLYKIIFVSMPL